MIALQLVVFMLSTQLALAQLPPDKLSQDPVFNTVLTRRLKYPRQAQWSNIYVRVFAEFTVDEKGHVQAISILNHSTEGVFSGLEPTVVHALKKLPALSLHYQGHYILPVTFQIQEYRHKGNLLVPRDSLYLTDLGGRIILQEVTITGSSMNSRQRIDASSRLDVEP